MTILVTGATGTVGRQVVEQLVARGADVRALVRDPAKANFPARVAVAQGDLLDVDSLRGAFSGVSTLFLLNAVASDEFTQALIALNRQRMIVHLLSTYGFIQERSERILSENPDHQRSLRGRKAPGRPIHKLRKLKQECCFDLIFRNSR